MKISTEKKYPNTRELIRKLKNKFSNAYSFSLYGVGNNRSIIARKSIFIGVEISRKENEIQIDPIFPSFLLQLIGTLFFIDSSVIRYVFPSKLMKTERELGLFLQNQCV